MWLMLSVGLALLMVLYSHEYFARMGAGAELFVVRVSSWSDTKRD